MLWRTVWEVGYSARTINYKEVSSMKSEKPEMILRGQMYFAGLDPVVGSEQGGTRPVLVIQNNAGNLHSPTIIVAPITSQLKKKRQPTHIGIPPWFGLPHQSMAMLEQIRTIDKSRLEDYIGCLDDDVMDYVDRALGISVGLTNAEPFQQDSRSDVPDEMVLCLCPTCVRQFIFSPEHIVQRVDRGQVKETCTYCSIRDGYDYRIIHRKKRMGDDRL